MICSLLNFMFCIPKKLNFDDIDVDNDGFITLNEFNDFFKNKTGQPPSLEQWIKFHMADIRHDGKISKNEYNNIIMTNIII